MFGEEPQQFGLAGERQLFDVIEHQCASLGTRHAARLAALGAGEGAGAKAEELALQERRRTAAGSSSTSGAAARGPALWMRRAKTDRPVPDSPRMRTGAEEEATCCRDSGPPKEPGRLAKNDSIAGCPELTEWFPGLPGLPGSRRGRRILGFPDSPDGPGSEIRGHIGSVAPKPLETVVVPALLE